MDDKEILIRKIKDSRDKILAYILKVLIIVACVYAAFIFGRDLLIVAFELFGIAADGFIFIAIGVAFLYVVYKILRLVLTPRKKE